MLKPDIEVAGRREKRNPLGVSVKNRQSPGELLESMKEAREWLKEEVRHVKKAEARRKTATRVSLVLLALLTFVVHGLYFSSPGWVVVNRNGEIDGLANRARATLQGKRFWREQLQEVNREISGEGSRPLRDAANERTWEDPVRDANREMEKFFGRYPQFRLSDAELHADAVAGRVNFTKWIQLNSYLEEMRRERFRELKRILPVVESKAG